MKPLKISLIAIFLAWFSSCELYAQETVSASKVLEQYIHSGLNNNLPLKQKEFQLQKSHLALQEAKSYFLPTITFQSDYSLADGGRKIDLPLGDLLNNAYASLNKLTSSNDFPMLNNQKIPLMPTVLQDTRIQTTVPLVNQEIKYITLIKKEAITEKQAEVNVYKRELIRDIRIAYYHYLQSLKVIDIYKNANQLLLDNSRYTEVLIKNGKGIKTDLLKVQVQVSNNSALLSEAQNKSKAAATYFNFLINAPLESAIIIDSSMYASIQLPVIDPTSGNISGREEINVLKSLQLQSILLEKKERAAWLPQLNAFANAGIQGRNYNLNSDNAYVVGGVQFKWTIFSGARTASKVKQAGNDVQALQLKLEETTQKLEVDNINKKLELASSITKFSASRNTQQLASEIYRETLLRYRQGLALSIELQDAFSRLINSQFELELNQTDIFIKKAEVERTTASYIF